MKTKIAVGAALLLSLGSAVAGSMLYNHDEQSREETLEPAAVSAEHVTPAMIAEWKQNSPIADYVAPRVPI
jgi:hypothetical protein